MLRLILIAGQILRLNPINPEELPYMKPTLKIFLAFISVSILTLAGIIGLQPAKRFFLEDRCTNNGGKWAANGNYCIQRNCAKDGNCRPSYNNNAVCSTLSVGIGQNELFFHLGMPERIDGATFVFTAGGGASQIKATIVNGVVEELDCGS